jgi:hypothetical protein
LKRFLAFLILTCLLLQPIPTKAAERSMDPLFPKPGFSAGWLLDGPIKYYDRETLFEYINGEAEIYFPYGFERLASAFYQKRNDTKIGLAADIYKMGSRLEAFGIYANFRRPDAERIKVGIEGFVNPSQLMFYQDRHFIQLSASGTTTLDRRVLETLARAISKKIPGKAEPPREIAYLKIPKVIPGTEAYVPQSLLGYAFFRRGLTAKADHNGKPVRILVVLEDSEASVKKTLQSYEAFLKEKGITPQWRADSRGLILFATDPLYQGIVLKQKGRFIAGVVDLENPEQGEPIVDQLLFRISLHK